MNGFLLIDKPEGWTSFDVVAKIRGIIESESRRNGVKKRIKVGHAGTLDPFATGLLLILVGDGTKQAQTLLKLDKSYHTVIKLGAVSNTDDRDGEIIDQNIVQPPSEQEVFDTLKNFEGEIEQIPPQFSAIKVKGKRACKSARAGEHIDLDPRKVTVRSIENVEYKWPYLEFDTSVSSGTYIRSLARDIGASLKVGGYVDVLRRTKIDQFDVSKATPISQLNYEMIQKLLLPLD